MQDESSAVPLYYEDYTQRAQLFLILCGAKSIKVEENKAESPIIKQKVSKTNTETTTEKLAAMIAIVTAKTVLTYNFSS